MPSLDDDEEDKVVKLLLLGRSGTGKTGLIGSLAKDYRIFLADFDNGTQILRDPAVVAPEHRKNVYIKKFYDKSEIIGNVLKPSATGYSKFVSEMSNWKEGTTSLGGIYSWTEKDIFVVDSLTFLGNTIFNQVLQLNNRSGQKPQLQDYGAAMDMQESILETLYNPAVKCNVIITAHIQYQDDEGVAATRKGVASAIGKKLAPKVPRYFNNVVQIIKTGSGKNVKRELHTTATFDVDLKNSKPSLVPPVMEPDLGKLFSILTGK